MRLITIASINHNEIVDGCLDSISDENQKKKMSVSRPNILAELSLFLQHARTKKYYLLTSFAGKEADLVFGNISCKELKDLYSIELSAQGKPSKKFYDLLRNCALRNICPFCGLGQVKTLEHYLPKSKYPLLSISPENLVPCCKDCNSGVKIPLSEVDQTFHPYFEDQIIVNDQWLFASLVESERPFVVVYYTSPPQAWSQTMKDRAEKHFTAFCLNSRFSIESANELATLNYLLRDTYEGAGATGVRDYLLNVFESLRLVHRNHWKTAMYETLANSSTYCDGGFMQE